MPPLYGDLLESKRIGEFNHERFSKVKISLVNHGVIPKLATNKTSLATITGPGQMQAYSRQLQNSN